MIFREMDLSTSQSVKPAQGSIGLQAIIVSEEMIENTRSLVFHIGEDLRFLHNVFLKWMRERVYIYINRFTALGKWLYLNILFQVRIAYW